MHPVQLSRDVQAAFANFASQRFHLDVQSLAANGMQAMRLEEPDDFRMNGFGNGMPGKARDALSLCADDVQEVQAKNLVLLRQPQNLAFAEFNEVACGRCCDRDAIALCEAENALGLDDRWGVDDLRETITVVVGMTHDVDLAAGENVDTIADISLANYGFVASHFYKTKPRVSHDLSYVVKAHS